MGWNEPEKGKEPWNGKKQPPDLDEALKRLVDKFKKVFSYGRKNASGPSTPFNSAPLVTAMFFLALFIFWTLSGIFIVDPAEQAAILRFGKYSETVGPGPHWIPQFIDSKMVLNVERVSHYSYTAQMLTKDENLVSVSVVVQYRIGDLYAYLFNVAAPEESLKQATSSALRQVVGATTLDEIITEGREAWGTHVQDALVKILSTYDTGIVIVNVAPQPARAPENVQDAFDDAIKAREDEKRFVYQARAYEAKVLPIAAGNAKRITEEAKAYAEQVVLRAKGEVAEYLALLPSYATAPTVTATRMYLASMEQVLSRSTKIIVDSKASNMLYLPLDKLPLRGNTPLTAANTSTAAKDSNLSSASVANQSLLDNREVIRQTIRLGRNN